MSNPEAKLCPHCGAPQAATGDGPRTESSAHRDEPESRVAELTDTEDSIPDMPLLAPGSNDETFLSTPHGRKIGPAEPDPILGDFVATGPGGASGSSIGSGASAPLKSRRSGSSSNFPVVNVHAPVNTGPISRSKARLSGSGDLDDDEDDADEPRRGWSGVLLASYASAVTLALVWFVIMQRSREKTEPVEAAPTVDRQESPRQGDLSKTVQPPEPILGEHFAKFRQSIRVGSLEITPIEVKRESVKLQRTSVVSASEVRDTGKKALVLKLKLQNISEETTFAPLDQTYLREHGERLVDTFVTTADQERIYPYPLALESEWTIVGQPFTELRPGESRTVSIVTGPETPPDTAGPFTWRVRLRTGIGRTDVIGVLWTPSPEKKAKPETEKGKE